MLPVGARPKQGLGRAASVACPKTRRGPPLLTNMDVIKSRALFLLDCAPEAFFGREDRFLERRRAVPPSESPEKHYKSTGMASPGLLVPVRATRPGRCGTARLKRLAEALRARRRTASPSGLSHRRKHPVTNSRARRVPSPSIEELDARRAAAARRRERPRGRPRDIVSSVGGSVKVARRGDAPRPRARSGPPPPRVPRRRRGVRACPACVPESTCVPLPRAGGHFVPSTRTPQHRGWDFKLGCASATPPVRVLGCSLYDPGEPSEHKSASSAAPQPRVRQGLENRLSRVTCR